MQISEYDITNEIGEHSYWQSHLNPGADPGFQVRGGGGGGGALKKIAPNGGRREFFWGISFEKFRGGGGRTMFQRQV